nr:C-type mannose receptor 2 [Crassostrea gigas]|eukprot:XP_019924383.1 PREDICTED: C-type mannose receptor 2-like [Crassostrea gigas]
MFISTFQIYFWILVFKTAKLHVKGQATVRFLKFKQDARFDHILPRSDEYYIYTLNLPSVIRCALECNARQPLCVGVLYNSNSKTCKLLRFYLTQVNIYKAEYGDNWKYYPMKLGVSDGPWFQYMENKHWYFYSENEMTWQEAKGECRVRNSHLVELTTIDENDFLLQKSLEIGSCVPTNTYNCGLWIGLNDQEEEGQFKWENSNFPVTFSNWLSGQPDGREHKNCVEMLQDGKWNDRHCRRNNPFVCEMA